MIGLSNTQDKSENHDKFGKNIKKSKELLFYSSGLIHQ